MFRLLCYYIRGILLFYTTRILLDDLLTSLRNLSMFLVTFGPQLLLHNHPGFYLSLHVTWLCNVYNMHVHLYIMYILAKYLFLLRYSDLRDQFHLIKFFQAQEQRRSISKDAICLLGGYGLQATTDCTNYRKNKRGISYLATRKDIDHPKYFVRNTW